METQTKPETSSTKPVSAEASVNHTIVVPPDGGWGWVIVCCGFLCGVLIDSVSLSFATIHRQLGESLGMSAVPIAWIPSTFNCLVFLLGPVASAVANRFGFRILLFTGSLIYFAGFTLAYFINSYALFILCFSIMSGVGASFVYMVLMASPGYWFDEKRSIAFGISSASSGFTCIAIPLASRSIEKTFGWRRVILLQAGLGVLAWLASFLIKKPPVAVIEVSPSAFKSDEESALTRNSHLNLSISTIGTQHSRIDRKLQQISTHTGIQIQPKPGLSRLSLASMKRPTGIKKIWHKMTGQLHKSYVTRPMYKKDIFYHSTTSLIMNKYNLKPGEYALSVHRTATSKEMIQQLGTSFICCPEAIKRPLKEMLDFSLLKNVTFVIIAIDTFLYYFSCFIPYVYMTKTCHQKGVHESTSILSMSLFGIGVSISRLCVGLVFIAIPKMSPIYLSSGTIIVSGVFLAGISFTLNDAAILILAFAAGLFTGPWVPLRSVLVVHYLGLEKLTSAMGLLFVAQALGCLLGIPFVEFVIHLFDEIYWNFYVTAILWVVIGIILAPIDLINARNRKPDSLKDSALYRK